MFIMQFVKLLFKNFNLIAEIKSFIFTTFIVYKSRDKIKLFLLKIND